ncbi:ADP-ribosylation factor-binding protein Gga isoform X1 [Lycorma delicatula]|uniref:ADP-ribosylation factor-binding protein Gga isoform X1 n=1 Tax=Lycorma delicatula TaxID=130591 RepID=UPI003F512971
MDIVTTSLEALIQRATSNRNQCPDTAAIDAFCGLVNREPDCAQMAARFITAKVHSLQEWEALQALHVLDACMKKCGSSFHAEVGKFRFLNELIKLVSPKYLGAHTPEPVRKRVLELMQSWTIRYPKETKIKEAYEMLKKQGVVKEERTGTIDMQRPVDNTTASSVTTTPSRQQNSIFQDEEKSRLLQKLLQSKNPDDLQAANRLIKTMVKEDERRVEQKVRHVSELEAVHNNARLLSEMLDSYRPGVSSTQDLELITELHTSCQRLRPTVFKLASEVHTDESLFNEVLAANDELGDVFDKYTKIIVQGKSVSGADSNNGGSSLLDLSTPSEELLPPPVSLLNEQLADLGLGVVTGITASTTNTLSQAKTLETTAPYPTNEQVKSDFAALGEIFTTPSTTASAVSVLSPLQPLSAIPCNLSLCIKSVPAVSNGGMNTINTGEPTEECTNKLKALEDLDILGATLLKENLPQTAKLNKAPSKVPMNQLTKATDSQPTTPLHNQTTAVNTSVSVLSVTTITTPKTRDSTDNKNVDLLSGTFNDTSTTVTTDLSQPTSLMQQNERLNGGDNLLSGLVSASSVSGINNNVSENNAVNISPLVSTVTSLPVTDKKTDVPPSTKKDVVKPLGDLNVSLKSIKPGTLPPRTLVDEKSGISIMLHISQSRPRPDVTVFVVTATNKNTSPLSDYLFQPVVPKTCRLRLQPPTATELPAHNPFLPPSVISQVMLIASPTQEPITLKFVVSYTMDEETITEMGEVTDIPLSAT